MSVKKRFDRELFNENDGKARAAVKNLLSGSKYRVEDNPKKMSVDLLVYDTEGKHIFNIETEIKKFKWETNHFKYDTVQLPNRKNKFCQLEVPTLFLIWNIDQTAYIAFWDKVVLNSPSVEVPNKYNFKGEFFYQIKLDSCIQEKLVENLL